MNSTRAQHVVVATRFARFACSVLLPASASYTIRTLRVLSASAAASYTVRTLCVLRHTSQVPILYK